VGRVGRVDCRGGAEGGPFLKNNKESKLGRKTPESTYNERSWPPKEKRAFRGAKYVKKLDLVKDEAEHRKGEGEDQKPTSCCTLESNAFGSPTAAVGCSTILSQNRFPWSDAGMRVREKVGGLKTEEVQFSRTSSVGYASGPREKEKGISQKKKKGGIKLGDHE